MARIGAVKSTSIGKATMQAYTLDKLMTNYITLNKI
jgi:hypothetical protein